MSTPDARPPWRGLAAALLLLSSSAACTDGLPRGPGQVLRRPTAAGPPGEDGPFPAARATMLVSARATQALEVQVTFPARADGTLAREAGPFPVVVFVQGGLVGLERYTWLAEHLATRGFVVAAPAHLGSLAFFETDNATLALEGLWRASASEGTLSGALPSARAALRSAVAGHSLGGVVAVRQWLAGGFDAVALLAAFPAEGDPVTIRAGSPVLSLVGANDVRKATAQQYLDGFRRFSPPRLFARVAGMNHYAWTEGASASELAGDGPEDRPLPEVRRDALRVLDLWLEARLRGDAGAQRALDSGGFAGLTELER